MSYRWVSLSLVPLIVKPGAEEDSEGEKGIADDVEESLRLRMVGSRQTTKVPCKEKNPADDPLRMKSKEGVDTDTAAAVAAGTVVFAAASISKVKRKGSAEDDEESMMAVSTTKCGHLYRFATDPTKDGS